MRPTVLAVCFTLLSASSALCWTLGKRADMVITRQDDGGYSAEIICRRGADTLEFNFLSKDLSGADATGTNFNDIRAVMLWIKLPDGRTDRWPVDMMSEGPSMTGQIAFSENTLAFFQNAESLEITAAPHHKPIFRSGMRGSGAARIAFRERCGI